MNYFLKLSWWSSLFFAVIWEQNYMENHLYFELNSLFP